MIKRVFSKIKLYCSNKKIQNYWKNKNLHCNASMGNICSVNKFATIDKISIGKKTYGEINVLDFAPKSKLNIGSYCSIAPNVWFLLGGDHTLNTISTYPFKVMCFGYEIEAHSKGDIVVGDDVWIGMNSTILSGVKIGQGAVVAAGSVVTKDVEPYSVVGGNPAKHIKYRLSENLREKLLKIDIVKLFDSFRKKDIDLIYEPLTEEVLDALIQIIPCP